MRNLSKVTKAMFAARIPEEMENIRELLGSAFGEGRYDEAAKIFAKNRLERR